MWLLQTKLLAAVVWKRGGQPFSCPCSQKCDALLKGDLLDMFVSGIHSRHSFWGFHASTPCQSLEISRSAARSTSSALLHRAYPFVAAAGKNQSHAEKQRVWSQSCGIQDLLQCSDCALSFSNFWHDTLRLHPRLGTYLHINRLLPCTSQLNKQSDRACLKQLLDRPVPSWILGWFAFSTYKSTSFI